jgi:hypothetical protein
MGFFVCVFKDFSFSLESYKNEIFSPTLTTCVNEQNYCEGTMVSTSPPTFFFIFSMTSRTGVASADLSGYCTRD